MNRKELTKTFMMISNWKNLFGLLQIYSALKGLNCWAITELKQTHSDRCYFLRISDRGGIFKITNPCEEKSTHFISTFFSCDNEKLIVSLSITKQKNSASEDGYTSVPLCEADATSITQIWITRPGGPRWRTSLIDPDFSVWGAATWGVRNPPGGV